MVVLPGRRKGFFGNDAYTKLLLHFDGADEATATHDSSRSGHAITFVEDGKLDSAQKKFGNTSLYVTTDYDAVYASSHADFAFGTGDYTVDGWVMIDTMPIENTTRRIWIAGPSLYIYHVTGGAKRWRYTDGGGSLDYETTIAEDTLYHMAFVRSSGNLYVFMNGTQLGEAAERTTDFAAADVYVGGKDPLVSFTGWVDEFRVSKGIARWAANFTPPTVAYR